MDSIFFERQEGQLCAQHCLNNLIQGPIFTAVDLAGYAHQLDEEEQATMAEGGLTNPEFLRFMQQPSSNMDDSGFFSGQVIARALSVWNLELESLTSPQMKRALEDPTSQQAFICNHDSHWLTVRKLGQQWFNLNSLLKRPELISDTYLSLFLHQLQLEGMLPPCEANQVLSLVRAEPPSPPSSAGHTSSAHSRSPQSNSREQPHSASQTKERGGTRAPVKRRRSPGLEEGVREEQDLQMAMAMSVSLEQSQEQFEIDQQLQLHNLKEPEGEDPSFNADDDIEEEEEVALTAAIYASLEDGHQEAQHSAIRVPPQSAKRLSSAEEPTKEELKSKREEKRTEERDGAGQRDLQQCSKDTGGDASTAATVSTVQPVSQEELRKRRLKHLEQ